MLLDFYKQAKPTKETNFFNTTMQLNRNYSARLHVDKNNHGPSYVIALGEYQGDRLRCYDKVRHDFVVSIAICVSCAYACADVYACAYACACAYVVAPPPPTLLKQPGLAWPGLAWLGLA